MFNLLNQKKKCYKENFKHGLTFLEKYELAKAKFKHYPATEWHNNIYLYNQNNMKLIPSKYNLVNKFIKSFFSLILRSKRRKLSHRRIRFIRLSMNRIFVSKSYIGHTNNKVIINFFTFNKEKSLLLKKMIKIYHFIKLNKYINIFKVDQKMLYRNRLSYKKNIVQTFKSLFYLKKRIEEKKIEGKKEKEKNTLINIRRRLTKTKEKKKINWKKIWIKRDIKRMKNSIKSTLDYKELFSLEKKKLKKKKRLKKKIYNNNFRLEYLFFKYNKKLLLNNYKFKEFFLIKLKTLINKIYIKKVEFRIVNLKKIYLNSDIFVESLCIKLRNRKNKVLDYLEKALNSVKIHTKRRIIWKQIKLLKRNRVIISTVNVNSLFQDHNKIYKEEIRKNFIVLNSLKHKRINGVRLEAAGRLRPRLTASRSIYKFKYKGNIRNVYSSFNGLPAVILRGHCRSNIQYTNINSKTRNGSFGLKGWVSSF